LKQSSHSALQGEKEKMLVSRTIKKNFGAFFIKGRFLKDKINGQGGGGKKGGGGKRRKTQDGRCCGMKRKLGDDLGRRGSAKVK